VITIRRAVVTDAPGIAGVEIASWRSTYRGVVPDHSLRGMSFTEHLSCWTRTLSRDVHATFVAVRESSAADADEQDICGFAMGGPDRTRSATYRGELHVLYLLEEVQRRGIGRRLVAAVATELARRGVPSMRVWALEKNHFCRFYAALGGVPAGRRMTAIGGRTLDVIAYGWPDTMALRAGELG
jgi:GNAT superfamily N-acetyltransferase